MKERHLFPAGFLLFPAGQAYLTFAQLVLKRRQQCIPEGPGLAEEVRGNHGYLMT